MPLSLYRGGSAPFTEVISTLGSPASALALLLGRDGSAGPILAPPHIGQESRPPHGSLQSRHLALVMGGILTADPWRATNPLWYHRRVASRRQKPLVVEMSAREAVAFREPFRRRGGSYADADVALDEVESLRAAQEPLVLRVEARGGSRSQRASLSLDWLCDSDGSRPRPLPPAFMHWVYDAEAAEWVVRARWIDAWENCGEPQWMVHAMATAVPDRRAAVGAACAAARAAGAGSRSGRAAGAGRPSEAALSLAEGWARGDGSASRADILGSVTAAAYDHGVGHNLAVACAFAARSAASERFEEFIFYASRSAFCSRSAAVAEAPGDAMATERIAQAVRGSVDVVWLLRHLAGGLP